MRKMKKIKTWSLLLTLLIAIGLTACDSDDNGEADPPDIVEEDENGEYDDIGDDEEEEEE